MNKIKVLYVYEYVNKNNSLSYNFVLNKTNSYVENLCKDNVLIESAFINEFFLKKKCKTIDIFINELNKLKFDITQIKILNKFNSKYNSLKANEKEVIKLIKSWNKVYTMYDVSSIINIMNPNLRKYLMLKIAEDCNNSYKYCESLQKTIKSIFNLDFSVYDLKFILDSLIVCYIDDWSYYKSSVL